MAKSICHRLKEWWDQRKHQQKLQAEEIQKVSWKELYKLNLPDWHLVFVGVIFSAILGAFYPLLSILFSEVLRVGQSSLLYPYDCQIRTLYCCLYS